MKAGSGLNDSKFPNFCPSDFPELQPDRSPGDYAICPVRHTLTKQRLQVRDI